MSNPKIVCVTPTIRPESMRQFREAWAPLFRKHNVTLVEVRDGDAPSMATYGADGTFLSESVPGVGNQFLDRHLPASCFDLFCRRTDGIRNLGFVAAAVMGADFVLTLDDDVVPLEPEVNVKDSDWVGENVPMEHLGLNFGDPIQAHLDALSLRVPLSWMNTAHMGAEYLRGVPYGVREEAPVMLSHGVWVGVPDFDGETQLRLERCPVCDGEGISRVKQVDSSEVRSHKCGRCNGTGKNPTGVPKTLPYYVGPVPRGVLFPLCGMNVMVRKEALPYLYFAPMGADSGFPDLHRFADIFMGIRLKVMFDRRGWACYTGASTVLHARASDATRNCEQERLGRAWNEFAGTGGVERTGDMGRYFDSYDEKFLRYADLIRSIQGGK